MKREVFHAGHVQIIDDRYDVIAVTINAPQTVRVLARDLDQSDAETVIKLAVYRRGVDTEFYAVAPIGKYSDGDELGAPDA